MLVKATLLFASTAWTSALRPLNDADTVSGAQVARDALLPRQEGYASASSECKCFPGDKCWPTKKEWDSLNKTVDGRLVATVPLASPCFQSWGNEDEEVCSELKELWTKPATHIDTSSS